MSKILKLETVGVTDVGRVRQHNEDSIAWDNNLAIIADGMGGYKAGNVASKMVVDGLLAGFRQLDFHAGNEVIIIKDLIDTVNNDIFRKGQENIECSKMGSTLAMLYLYENHIILSHAGDSRIYRLRGDTYEQLTHDHSLVYQLMEQGTINKEDAKNSRYKNIITRAMGVRIDCEADVNKFKALSGDVYLICSDGLSNYISDDAMKSSLSDNNDNFKNIAESLIFQANQAGGDDNISVILVAVLEN